MADHHLLEADHAVAFALNAGEDFGRQAPAYTVGLDHGKGSFHSRSSVAGEDRTVKGGAPDICWERPLEWANV
ncbi:hypothetical protein GCM10022631_33030 [Deinococcus rubellus]